MRTIFHSITPIPTFRAQTKPFPLGGNKKEGLETIYNPGFLILINNNIFYLWHRRKTVNYAFTCDSLGCKS